MKVRSILDTTDASTQSTGFDSRRVTPPWVQWTLLVIIAVGAFFRLYHLQDRNMPFSDESTYLIESRLMLSGAKLLAHKWGLYSAENTHHILEYIGLHTFSHSSIKPLQAMLGAVALWLFGDSPYSALLVPALFGIFSIPLLYFLTRRFFQDEKVALMAAAFIAISPWHMTYSRANWDEIPGVFFMWLAIWCCYEGFKCKSTSTSNRWIWSCGLVAGASFVCNTRWLFLPLLFATILVIEKMYSRRRIGEVIVNCLRIFAGFAVVIVICELPYHWALVEQKDSGLWMRPFFTFWESLSERMKYAIADWRLETFPAISYWYIRTEGLIGLFALIGCAVAVRKMKRFEYILVLLLAATSFIFVWMLTWKVLIYMSFGIPASCILAALGWRYVSNHPTLSRLGRWRSGLHVTLLGAAFGFAAVSDWNQCQIASHLKEAVVWIQKNRPNDRVLATKYEAALCEYDTLHVGPLSTRVQMEYLEGAQSAGFKLLIIDDQKFNAIIGGGPPPYPDYPPNAELLPSSRAFVYPTIDDIERTTPPIATFTNELNREFFFIFARENTTYLLARNRQFLESINPPVDSVIRIYELDQALKNLRQLYAPVKETDKRTLYKPHEPRVDVPRAAKPIQAAPIATH